MTEVRETMLPGVGVRHVFTSEEGRDVGVIVHHDGRREFLLYSAKDPDACAQLFTLSEGDTTTLAEILGVSVINEVVSEVRHELGDVALEWVEIDDHHCAVGTSIGDGAYRSKTGASIIAVIRNGRPIPEPGPDFQLFAGDIAIIVGAHDELNDLRSALCS